MQCNSSAQHLQHEAMLMELHAVRIWLGLHEHANGIHLAFLRLSVLERGDGSHGTMQCVCLLVRISPGRTLKLHRLDMQINSSSWPFRQLLLYMVMVHALPRLAELQWGSHEPFHTACQLLCAGVIVRSTRVLSGKIMIERSLAAQRFPDPCTALASKSTAHSAACLVKGCILGPI